MYMRYSSRLPMSHPFKRESSLYLQQLMYLHLHVLNTQVTIRVILQLVCLWRWLSSFKHQVLRTSTMW